MPRIRSIIESYQTNVSTGLGKKHKKTQPRSQGVICSRPSLAPRDGKRRYPGNEVGKNKPTKWTFNFHFCDVRGPRTSVLSRIDYCNSFLYSLLLQTQLSHSMIIFKVLFVAHKAIHSMVPIYIFEN